MVTGPMIPVLETNKRYGQQVVIQAVCVFMQGIGLAFSMVVSAMRLTFAGWLRGINAPVTRVWNYTIKR